LTRREFFKSFYRIRIGRAPVQTEVSRQVESVRVQRFSLGDLSHLPDSLLGQVVPVLPPGITVATEESGVSLRADGQGDEGFVGLDPQGAAAVRLFDGKRTLQEIGAALDTLSGEIDGFTVARDAFLALAARGVCHPAGPPV
jgi:hypothetical protein